MKKNLMILPLLGLALLGCGSVDTAVEPTAAVLEQQDQEGILERALSAELACPTTLTCADGLQLVRNATIYKAWTNIYYSGNFQFYSAICVGLNSASASCPRDANTWVFKKDDVGAYPSDPKIPGMDVCRTGGWFGVAPRFGSTFYGLVVANGFDRGIVQTQGPICPKPLTRDDLI